jgi:plasmid stabilization system protein ParE
MSEGFRLHPEAARDITEIWEYIASDSPQAGRRVREDILEAMRKLVAFPHQGHRRTDLTSRPLCFKRVRNYLVAYAPDEKPLWVIARHARTPQPERHGRDPEGPESLNGSHYGGVNTAFPPFRQDRLLCHAERVAPGLSRWRCI